MSGLAPEQKKRAIRTAWIVGAIVAGMTGLVFCATPLYGAFCRATGYGGTTQLATKAPSRILARTIEVRFDTNVATGLPIEFTPTEPSQRLHLGETGLAFFRVRNLSNHPVTAVATYNVAPFKVGIYFQKLECFCFRPRVFQPGESAELPVVYFVDPQLASDRQTEEVGSIVLSYTYFRTPEDAQRAVAAAETAAAP